MKWHVVYPSVCLSIGPQQAGDIGQLLQQWQANAGSATLSAYVGS